MFRPLAPSKECAELRSRPTSLTGVNCRTEIIKDQQYFVKLRSILLAFYSPIIYGVLFSNYEAFYSPDVLTIIGRLILGSN